MRPLAPPPREVVLRRWPVRTQVPARQLYQRDVGVHIAPAVKPQLGPHERDALPAARAKAQKAPASDRLEDDTPAGFQYQLNSLRAALPHPRDQLLAGHHLAIEGHAPRIDDAIQIWL